jgi:glycosyltransferase involved in cell wall biosynthesis
MGNAAKKPKKALIVNPYWDTMGGGERYTASLARLLVNRGWIVDILAPEDFSGPIKQRFGIDLSAVNWTNKNFNPPFTINYSLLFWLSDGSLPVSFAKKTVIHMQFPFASVGGRRLPNYLKSRFYTFVANSRFTASFIDREYQTESRVIYPPVDVDRFKPGQKSDTILYVGRFSGLTQHKGQEILIDAFSGIRKKIPGWKLILAGGTTVGARRADMDRLKQKASALPVEFVFDPDLSVLHKLYASAKIFWSAAGFGVDESKNPTKVEHFGISVVEAMAAGCVPVITGLGGYKEIVRNAENGFLWNTTDQLCSFTLNLISQPSQLSQLSRAAVIQSKMFSWERFNSQFSDLLQL